jgi:hypothetical protein
MSTGLDNKLIFIDATYFCAGILIDSKGIVTEAAPILRWSIGKSYKKILEFLSNKGALRNYREVGNTLDKQIVLW